MSRAHRRIGLISFVSLFAAMQPIAQAVPIYGGPTYNSITGNGYQFPALANTPGFTAGNGVGVTYATKYDTGVGKGYRAFRWDSNGTITELANLGTNASGTTNVRVYAINATGTMIGSATNNTGSGGGQRAVRWSAAGAATTLGTLGPNNVGASNADAEAINAAGTAVGYSYKYAGDTYLGNRAVRWDANSVTPAELGNLGLTAAGTGNTSSYAINASGTIVGISSKFANDIDGGSRAVRWNAGSTNAIELGNLGTDSNGKTSTSVFTINAAGTSVGYANKYNGNTMIGERAVRWDAGGTAVTELGNLVGSRAVFCRADGSAVDLNAFLSPTDAAL